MKFLFIAPPYRAPTRIAQYKIDGGPSPCRRNPRGGSTPTVVTKICRFKKLERMRGAFKSQIEATHA
jgi:hypothetical protein